MAVKKVGILTGGGDCPGLNAAIRAVVRRAQTFAIEWIATLGGLAGGADFILVPEKPYRLEDMCAVLESRRRRGRHFSIVVVAEGAAPTGEPPPAHVGEGGSSVDRILATRFGSRAVDLVREGRFGHMVALQGTRVVPVALEQATSGPKYVDLDRFADAEVFFG